MRLTAILVDTACYYAAGRLSLVNSTQHVPVEVSSDRSTVRLRVLSPYHLPSETNCYSLKPKFAGIGQHIHNRSFYSKTTGKGPETSTRVWVSTGGPVPVPLRHQRAIRLDWKLMDGLSVDRFCSCRLTRHSNEGRSSRRAMYFTEFSRFHEGISGETAHPSLMGAVQPDRSPQSSHA